MNAPNPNLSFPLSLAPRPDDPATLAFAGVIARALSAARRPLIRGLSEEGFGRLLAAFFPGLEFANGTPSESSMQVFAEDEFDDLVALLLEHRASDSIDDLWLAHAIATAAMGNNHLWQDMGLPSRKVLSALLNEHFPTLAVLNVKDMKWKKFFYRQLCARAGVFICKSPNCAECCDFALCFGPEEQ